MGVDVIALLAVCGALAVGEYLAAAVISVMLASGRALEGWAAGRARLSGDALDGHDRAASGGHGRMLGRPRRRVPAGPGGGRGVAAVVRVSRKGGGVPGVAVMPVR
jgi:hypothetical protein